MAGNARGRAAPTTKAHPIVGVIGGMGPEATVELMRRVIAATPASDDADHIHMIVDSNPKVPSRIAALLEGGGEDPAPHIAAMARRLETAGADFLVIACNTAHHYHGAAAAAVSIPVWNLIDMTVARLAAGRPPLRRVGVLASTAVRRTRLFERASQAAGIELLYPAGPEQDAVLAVIRAVKAGPPGAGRMAAYNAAARALETAGAQALLLACTELSVVAGGLSAQVPVFDNLQILAEEIVRVARI